MLLLFLQGLSRVQANCEKKRLHLKTVVENCIVIHIIVYGGVRESRKGGEKEEKEKTKSLIYSSIIYIIWRSWKRDDHIFLHQHANECIVHLYVR